MINSRSIFTVFIAACLFVLLASFTNAHASADEDRLFKAAFIYNFAKFTTWPDASWLSTPYKLNLCITGDDELTPHLKQLSGRTLTGRTLNVSQVTIRQLDNCHILYIAKSQQSNFRKILDAISDRSILSIAQFKGFAQSGGIIELHRDNGQTEINVNLKMANNAKLSLSSRLLILANIVDQDK